MNSNIKKIKNKAMNFVTWRKQTKHKDNTFSEGKKNVKMRKMYKNKIKKNQHCNINRNANKPKTAVTACFIC